MLKSILMTLFLGIGLHLFCEATPQKPVERYAESLSHLEIAYAQLLFNQPLKALTEFENATAFLDDTDKSSCVIGFLISFGQVIAYDHLGLREQCMQSVGSLLFAINSYDEKNCKTETEADKNILSTTEYDIAIGFMMNLSTIAPSPEVQELLFSILDEMSAEILPAFKFAEQAFMDTTCWDYDRGEEASIEQCKSFWKKMRDFFKEAGDFIYCVVRGIKAASEAKDAWDEFKQKFNGD